MFGYMMKLGYVDMNKLILERYSKLNLTSEETLLLLSLIELYKNNNTTLSVNSLAKKVNVTTDVCSNSLNGLLNKGLVTLNIEYTKSGKAKEVFNLDDLIITLEKMFLEEIKNDKISKSENLIKEMIELIEASFNKTLTPYELEIILTWVEAGETINTIKKALDIALSKNNTNLKYLDKIVLNSKKQDDNVDEEQSKVLDDIFRNLR